jgi:DUF1680 family protein
MRKWIKYYPTNDYDYGLTIYMERQGLMDILCRVPDWCDAHHRVHVNVGSDLDFDAPVHVAAVPTSWKLIT